MEKKRLFWLLFYIFGLFCAISCKKKAQIVIHGELTNNISEYIYISEVHPDELLLLDSAKIVDGKFTFTLQEAGTEHFTTPNFFQISVQPGNAFITIAQAGDVLTLQADARQLAQTYTISGSDNALIMNELDQRLKSFIDSTDMLFAIYEHHIEDDSARSFVEQNYNALVARHSQYLIDFIHQHRTSLAAIAAFYQRYNRCIFINEKENLPLLNEIYDSLAPIYPQNENVLWLEERLKLKKNEIL